MSFLIVQTAECNFTYYINGKRTNKTVWNDAWSSSNRAGRINSCHTVKRNGKFYHYSAG